MPNYPYVSGTAGILTAFTQLRKGFPTKVDAGYLQRFNIAPSNESYVISILKFLGLLDEEGNRVEDKTDFFFGADEAFKRGFEATLREAYAQLFQEMGDDAVDAERSALVHWFRAADKTSDLVGQRQATTFQALAALAGHGDLPTVRIGAAKKTAPVSTVAAKKTAHKKASPKKPTETDRGRDVHGHDVRGSESQISDGRVKAQSGQDVGLSVRIEVNLPAGGDAATYDAIFASIKKHLMS